MTITATFSDGSTDAYTGDRAVTVAWALVNKATGKVVHSGHSLDAAKARKTATGAAKQVVFHDSFDWDRTGAHTARPSRNTPQQDRDLYETGRSNIAAAIATHLRIEFVAC